MADADTDKLVLVGPKPLTTICAWCVQAGKVENQPGASHGICPACLAEHFILMPLHGVIATLEGPEFLDQRRRKSLAVTLRQVAVRIERAAK